MNPDRKNNFQADKGPTNPFENAANIPDLAPATRIIMLAMNTEHQSGSMTHFWLGFEEQIEALGYEHGQAVLREISVFVLEHSQLSLAIGKTMLRAYCDIHQLQVPQVPEWLQAQSGI